MSYCRKCGAYIPDGYTKCLACGLEQEERENFQTDSNASVDPLEESRRRNEEMQRRFENNKKRHQEENRKWAENERRRRQEQQSQRQHSADEDYRYEDSRTRPKGYQSNRLMAALSYIPALFILPFIFCSNDPFALYHARQGLILFAVCAAGQILGAAFGLDWIVTIMQIYWVIKGISNANAGKMEPLPYIGNIFFKEK